MKRIEAIIFDWAGTTVDYGCMAPLQAMQEAFLRHELNISLAEIRKPMGLAKLEHIKEVLAGKKVTATTQDIQTIYTNFEANIMLNLHRYTDLIPGILEVQTYLREHDIKIGSTTGYTQAMIDIVASAARKAGYQPDCIVTPDQVTRGRPYPYMLQQNLEALDIQDIHSVIKVGDTLVDIQEGINAGCWSVGVIRGSSMLGLQASEVAELSESELKQRTRKIKEEMSAAGAHYVLDSINELPAIIHTIQSGNNHVGR